MTGYSIDGISDRYDGRAIHITYDQNSWNSDIDGGIDVSTKSADQIMAKIFDVAWAYQMHATLEIEDSRGKHPHVYFGGHNNHWADAKAHNNKPADWDTKGIAALEKVLTAQKKKIKALIQKAIDADGNI